MDDLLAPFGLTSNESRAYEALVRFGRQTPAEIAPRAAVSRGRVYQVLDEMARKGLVTEVGGSPRTFVAVEPRVALTARLEERRAELAETTQLLEVACSELEGLASAREPAEFPALEVLGKPEQIAVHFQKLQTEATQEILVFSKPPYVAGPEEENPGEMEALRRGVRYAALYERSICNGSTSIQHLNRYREAGEQARMVDELPMKLAIFDRRRALMPLASTEDPAQSFTSVIVHDDGLVKALAFAFDHLWGHANEIPRFALPQDLSPADARAKVGSG